MAKARKWGEDPDFSGPKDWFRNSLIIREIKKRKSSGRILDFGAGNGNLTIRLAKEGFTCLGIDKSKTAIRNLNKKAKSEGLSHKIVGKIGDEKSILKLRDKFDIIVCGETLEHIENDQKVVSSFYKKLKQKGVCVITVPADMDSWDINDDFSSHYRRYGRSHIVKLFESENFKVVKVLLWGFPLGRAWYKMVYLPLVRIKIEKEKIYSDSKGLLGKLVGNNWIKKIASWLFWFDHLFNWTNLGKDMVVVARK